MRISIPLSLCSLLLPATFARPWTPSDPCPTELKARISSDPCSGGINEYGCPKNKIQIASMDSIHDVLTHCSNITSLELRVAGAGCSQWPERYNFPFSRSGSDKYPALKKIKLEGYNFGDYQEVVIHPAQSIWDLVYNIPKYLLTKTRWRSWVNEQIPVIVDMHLKSNFGAWLDAMDWSVVEEFGIVETHRGNAFTDEMIGVLPQVMTNLKRLVSTNLTFIAGLEKNTLTHLRWVGNSCNTTLPTILKHQGQSLKSLEFRCEEMSCHSFPSNVNISALPTMAPNLKHIAINIKRNETWPLDDMATIASLPHMKTVDLYFRLQSDCRHERNEIRWDDPRSDRNNTWCKGTDQYLAPLLNQTTSRELYKHMKSSRPKEDEPLGNATFWIGDWSRAWDGPLYSPPWLENRRAKFICNSEDKEEGEAWCIVDGDGEYYNRRNYDDSMDWDYEDYDQDWYAGMEGVKDWQHV